MFMALLFGFLVSVLASLEVRAYIPATPTNNTNAAIQQGLNVSDVSKLHLQWYSTGSLLETVSYQLVGADSTGFSQGALLHFTEDMYNNDTTTTPWIALVACDANATNMDLENDIFSMARDAGAKAALLYSIYSQECIINPEYADPANFDQVMDIFSTQSLTTATLIEYQFGQFGWRNESIYGQFNSSQLNKTGETVNKTFETGNPQAPGYIFATLTAYNATQGAPSSSDNGGNDNGGGSGSGGSTNTGLAMIILYAITGCVSALFCVVIISGAVRAIRHPERYGPRARRMGPGGLPPQSRARGLTRAMLDTFPIVKFGGAQASNDGSDSRKDIESRPESSAVRDSTIMKDWEVMDVPIEMIERGDGGDKRVSVAGGVGGQPHPLNTSTSPAVDSMDSADAQPRASGSRLASPRQSYAAGGAQSSGSEPPNTSGETGDVVPAAIGRETCPICIIDFEEGDDLRVLPCEGKHRFHQDCVDPWLLELSTSCPICRQDFHALETMLSGSDENYDPQHPSMNDNPTTPHPAGSGNGSNPSTLMQNQGRFSRYLRFARRRHNHRDDVGGSQHEESTSIPERADNLQPPVHPPTSDITM